MATEFTTLPLIETAGQYVADYDQKRAKARAAYINRDNRKRGITGREAKVVDMGSSFRVLIENTEEGYAFFAN